MEGITFFVIFTLFTGTRCLQFSVNTTLDGLYCAYLHCLADKSFVDDKILFIYSLTVYNVTVPNTPTKLTSLSTIEPNLYVDQSVAEVLNATGSVSKLRAEINMALSDTVSCADGSFQCELEFVNMSGDAEVISKTVTTEKKGPCYYAEKENVKLQMDNAELQTENTDLKGENGLLKTKLSRLEEAGRIDEASCNRSASSSNDTRVQFMLWGKVPALCDTVTDGGGWIVIQRRKTGDIYFYRNWESYKKGFGTPDNDFWLGNDNIHSLTSQGYTELRIDMALNGKEYFAHYSYFGVASETFYYRLSLNGYNGTASDSMTDDKRFSTFDNGDSCATSARGAWWYPSGCHNSNLNGLWSLKDSTGVLWSGVTSSNSLNYTEMKIRLVS